MSLHIAYLHYQYGQDTALCHVRQFAAAAQELGHRVDVHAMNLAPADESRRRSLSARLRRLLKRSFGRYLHDPKELLWNLRYVGKETRLLRDEPPDVLLVRSQRLGISCVPVARRLGVPLVLEVNAPAEEARWYIDDYAHLSALQEWTDGWKMRRADAVTVVSQALKDYLVVRYGLPPERLTVVPNGADPELFQPGTPLDDELAAWPGDGPVVGYVGSFQKWHAIDLLRQMTERLAAERPELRFLFVGDGPEACRLRDGLELGDRALFTGRVPHARVPGLVAGLDVGVVAETAFYQCPLKVIEWMAAGKAVVAPNHPPLAELLTDGAEGRLVRPRDLEALVAAVGELIDRPEKRQAFGEAAARRVRDHLSWTHNADRVAAVCRETLARRAA